MLIQVLNKFFILFHMELSFALTVSTENYFNRSSLLPVPLKKSTNQASGYQKLPVTAKPNTPFERAWKTLLKTGVKILVRSRGELQWKLPIKGERVTKSWRKDHLATNVWLLRHTYYNPLFKTIYTFLSLFFFYTIYIQFSMKTSMKTCQSCTFSRLCKR